MNAVRSRKAPATPRVPILMYHAVAHTPASKTYALSVSPQAFAKQMRMLNDAGFTPLTTARLAASWRHGIPLPPHPILITFDDGYEGVHRHALPVLARHHFASTVFVATGWIRGAHEISGAAPDTMLDWHQVRELAEAGMEIGGHSHSHPQLDQITDEQLWFEVLCCREIIDEQLGRDPVSFAYPYGYSNRRVRRTVHAAGFSQSLAVGNALARPAQGPYALERITVRRSTHLREFERLLDGREIARNFARDRTLTKGYALVRRSRRLMRIVTQDRRRFASSTP
ncbi:polysaccharide deacetylase family protein [Streptomyces sp. NPDC048825]|uniref:polysaccharide deacetylase family protein n=1 Tax=Streptomyces sp. NPDC048825 TaxID=3365592 RepID=UPI00372264FE